MAWDDVGEFELMFQVAGWPPYLAEHPLGAVGEARSKNQLLVMRLRISVSSNVYCDMESLTRHSDMADPDIDLSAIVPRERSRLGNFISDFQLAARIEYLLAGV
jgi:hypothetical protein